VRAAVSVLLRKLAWLYAALRAGRKLAPIPSVKAWPFFFIGIPKEIGTTSGEYTYLLQHIPQGTEWLVSYQMSNFAHERRFKDKRMWFFIKKKKLSQWNGL